MSRKQSVQLNLPPVEVKPLYDRRLAASRPITPLKWWRDAALQAQLSGRYMAAAMCISEALYSAQSSDHCPDKHLSLRRAAGVNDAKFWLYLALAILQGIGLRAVVMDEEQYDAHLSMMAVNVDTFRAYAERRSA
jgi:hypothetical protein